MELEWVIQKLIAELDRQLPGDEAHLEMTPYRKGYRENIPEDARLSAVMLNLHQTVDGCSVLLIKRPAYDGVHSGQVSFPGGRKEPHDTDDWKAAVRENEEETGITEKSIHRLGSLSQIYIPPSRSLVFPFVVYSDPIPPMKMDPREVDYSFYLPIEALMDAQVHQLTDIRLREGLVLKDAPCFQYKGEIIWGATCAILNELKWILKRSSV